MRRNRTLIYCQWCRLAQPLQKAIWRILKTLRPELPQCYYQSLSYAQLFVTPQVIAHQVPLSMGFSRQEYWSGWPFPSPRTTILSSYSTSVYLPKKCKNTNSKNVCTPLFIAILLIKNKIWKQPKCPPTNGWIKKM